MDRLSEGKDAVSSAFKRHSAKLSMSGSGSRSRSRSPRPMDDKDWEMDGIRVPALLLNGTPMTKYSEKKGPKPLNVRLDPDQGQILWPSRKSGIISIENIKELRAGTNARDHILKCEQKPQELEKRWLTIIYTLEDKYKSLHLVAPNESIHQLWHVTLIKIHKMRLEFMAGLSSAERTAAIWDKHYWKGADKSGDAKLDKSEVKALCRRLNFWGDEDEIKRRFKEADQDNKGYLDFADFQTFVKRLKFRAEVQGIYDEARGEGAFDFKAFERFLKEKQKSKKTTTEIEVLYRRFATPSIPATRTAQEPTASATPAVAPPPLVPQPSYSDTPAASLPPLSVDAFITFLQSSDNSIFTDHHAPVYQDMTQPLANYFISSSHNTYLVGNQLTGESTVEGYVRALLSSSRSVEMDIYDGDNGEPMITHGGTLTTDVPVRAICQAVAKYAFVSSPYPVIISAEVHCGVPQQVVLAKILGEVFGKTLVTEPLEGFDIKPGAGPHDGALDKLPSPEQLKGRILLKAKNKYIDAVQPKLAKLPEETDTSSDEEGGDAKEKGGFRSKAKGFGRKLFGGKSDSDEKKRAPSPQPPTPNPPATPQAQVAALPPQKQAAAEALLMANELLPMLIYTTGVRFRGFDAGTNYPLQHLFSLSETRATALIEKEIATGTTGCGSLVKHNTDHVVRIYPHGTRVNSSNYEPQRYWAFGCQLVTLNWQTADVGYLINHAMFQRNGRAGYLLKPACLRSPTTTFVRRKYLLRIHLLSAQQLPRPKDDQGHEIVDKNTVDPYVKMYLHIPPWPGVSGIGARSAEGEVVERESSVIRNNGFNPMWDEVFELPFDTVAGNGEGSDGLEELVFLRITVKDKDVDRDSFVGQFCASVGAMEQGYRHLPLYDEQVAQYLFSSLFVHLEIKQVA